MSGFIKGLQNMLAGKPVFEAPASNSDDTTQIQQPRQTQPRPTPQRTEKPLVIIERVEYTPRGTTEMSLNMHIRNRSREPVILQDMELLGTRRGLGIRLEPGESNEVRDVYRGPILTNTNDRHIHLDFKAADGNFFRTVHRAEYERESSGAFAINDVKYEPPIRDI